MRDMPTIPAGLAADQEAAAAVAQAGAPRWGDRIAGGALSAAQRDEVRAIVAEMVGQALDGVSERARDEMLRIASAATERQVQQIAGFIFDRLRVRPGEIDDRARGRDDGRFL